MKTKPNKFKSGKELIDIWKQYCEWIVENGYIEAPTQTAFCGWLEKNFEATDRKTIYNTLNKIFPDIKGEFERIRGDTVAAGAMLGKYQPTMSIFALKNWCGWKDQKNVDMDVVADAKVQFCFDRLPNGTSEDELMG